MLNIYRRIKLRWSVRTKQSYKTYSTNTNLKQNHKIRNTNTKLYNTNTNLKQNHKIRNPDTKLYNTNTNLSFVLVLRILWFRFKFVLV